MLKYLHIKHFTIITELTIDWDKGFTVLTGETGAGKSILVDALTIVLGDRVDSDCIQAGEERCEIAVSFDVATSFAARQWLVEAALAEENECIIRRIISRDGRSRIIINGHPCTLQQVRSLGVLLVQIHGQNTHTLLLKNSYQQQLLDKVGQLQKLAEVVKTDYEKWVSAQRELASYQYIAQEQGVRTELLNFQLQEFVQLGLQAQELKALEQEQQQLGHASHWMATCEQAINTLTENEHSSVLNSLQTVSQQLKTLAQKTPVFVAIVDMLAQAIIQVEEATKEIQQYFSTLELNPERLQAIEQRLTAIYALARKHRVEPEQLLEKQRTLEQQVQELSHLDTRMDALRKQIAALTASYQAHAARLTTARQAAIKPLSLEITKQMRALGMPNAQFVIQLLPVETGTLHVHGNEHVQFLVSTNPGQPLKPLHKVASGGELSRMSLAIQVVTAQAAVLGTLIFDEVDTGVGGGVAQIVGQQLRILGECTQVLCVTHLPQVAAQAHHHFRIEKQIQKDAVTTQVINLSFAEKIKEIARMLGGVKITTTTLAHAREMLETLHR